MSSPSKSRLRILVLLFSFVMFCIQAENAIMKLIYPPEVDSTSVKNIVDIDLPVITLCHTNQTNETMINEVLFYSNEANLLSGLTRSKISWGDSHNLTHEQLLDQVFGAKKQAKRTAIFDNDGDNFNTTIVYLPKYGFCKEITNYSPRVELFIMPMGTQDMRIFITDMNYRSYILPDFTSHKGSPIIAKKNEVHMYDVDVEISSSCKVTKDNGGKDDFKKCVDDEIQKQVGKLLGCVPPWMSLNNQCLGTYPSNFTKIIPRFWLDYINPPTSLRNLGIEMKCRKYCSVTRSFVQVREKTTKGFNGLTEVFIAFNQQVQVKEKVFNYGLFQFIVDIGSSFGLWLGLSILGLYDLWIQIVDFFTSNQLCKMMNSALGK